MLGRNLYVTCQLDLGAQLGFKWGSEGRQLSEILGLIPGLYAQKKGGKKGW